MPDDDEACWRYVAYALTIRCFARPQTVRDAEHALTFRPKFMFAGLMGRNGRVWPNWFVLNTVTVF